MLPKSDRSSTAFYAATLQDRALALFFDLVLTVPLFSIVLSPLLQKFQVQMTFSPQSTEFLILLFLVGVGYAGLLTMYFAFMWWKHSATLGQQILKLRVLSTAVSTGVTSESASSVITFGQALIRALFFLLSVLCLGVPFLNLFSQSKRKGFHELASETETVSRKPSFESPPRSLEKQFIRNMALGLGFLTTVWSALMLRAFYREAIEGTAKRAELQDAGYLCSWEPQTSSVRMDEAIAKFLSMEFEKDCLAKEADFALWTQSIDNQAWGYFAKSFLQQDPGSRKSYADKACELAPNGTACAAAGGSSESLTGYLMKTRQLFESGDFARVDQYLEALEKENQFPLFQKNLRSRMLWMRGHKQEAVGYFSAAISFFEAQDGSPLATWMCFEEVENECSSRARKTCQQLDWIVGKEHQQLGADSFAALFLDRKCRQENVADLLRLRPDMESLAKVIREVDSSPAHAARLLGEREWRHSEELRLRLLARALKSARPGVEQASLQRLLPTTVASRWISSKLPARSPASIMKAEGP